MDNQQPSSSSVKQPEMDKVEDGQVEKTLKKESNAEVEDKKCFIDKLPPEMLMEIFKHLDVKSLRNSRLVYREWNAIARKVIQSRDDVEIRFFCQKTEETLKIEGGSPRASLENYIECFEDSKESPLYTRFRFDDFEPSVFDHPNWLKFISYFGKNIKCLKFKAAYSEVVDDAIEWAEKLRNLLVNQVSNLQEFGLHLPHKSQHNNAIPASREIQLFPTTRASPVQLPHLKVLYLNEDSFSYFTGIFTDLLGAAVNLQKIEPFARDCCASFESFSLLHSLGKLDCLQTTLISLDTEILPKLQDNPSFPLGFKLKNLILLLFPAVYNDPDFWPHASVFISHLFESSKDSFRELYMEPVGFLSALQLPKFSQLVRLSVFQLHCGQKVQVLPKGLEISKMFPLLQNLKLQVTWTDFFPHDGTQNGNVSCLSNLKNLKINGRGMRKEDIARIAQVCPNLKYFIVNDLNCGGEAENFPEVATAIWTHLKQLESLDLKIIADDPNAFPAIDSTFTGFSGEDVIRLYELIENEKIVKKQESQIKSESKIQLDAERISPSILDLKDLRKLTVDLRSGFRKDKTNLDLPSNILTVGEKYAFKLMENLTYKIEKKYFW